MPKWQLCIFYRHLIIPLLSMPGLGQFWVGRFGQIKNPLCFHIPPLLSSLVLAHTFLSFFFSFFCLLSFSFLCPFLFSVFPPNVQQAPPISGQVWLVFCGYNDGNVSYQTGGYCLKIPEGMIYIYLLLCLLLVVFNNIYTYRMLDKYLCIRKVKLIK